MKKIKNILKVFKDSTFNTKVLLFFSTKERGSGDDYYDKYEKNFTYTNLNPVTIKAYVYSITSEALVWKQLGTKELGAKAIICEDRYINWFKTCTKIQIDNKDYQVYKDNIGSKAYIEQRPGNLIRVIVNRA